MTRAILLEKLSKKLEKLPDAELLRLLKIADDLGEVDRRCLKYLGIWAERADLEDSVSWLRRLRDEQRFV